MVHLKEAGGDDIVAVNFRGTQGPLALTNWMVNADFFKKEFPCPVSDRRCRRPKTQRQPPRRSAVPPHSRTPGKKQQKTPEQNSECSSSLAGAALTVTNYVIHVRL